MYPLEMIGENSPFPHTYLFPVSLRQAQGTRCTTAWNPQRQRPGLSEEYAEEAGIYGMSPGHPDCPDTRGLGTLVVCEVQHIPSLTSRLSAAGSTAISKNSPPPTARRSAPISASSSSGSITNSFPLYRSGAFRSHDRPDPDRENFHKFCRYAAGEDVLSGKTQANATRISRTRRTACSIT